MLKLIALKIYKDCAKHIYKCLKPDVYYYFCNEFVFDHKGKLSFRSDYHKSLQEDFFINIDNLYSESGSNDIQINVSAIVGKNGDGKSSIIEIILRLINNLADSNGITDIKLQHAYGVRAELTYQYNNGIYQIKEKSKDGAYLVHYADIEGGEINTIGTQVHLNPHSQHATLFHTWVSNYSIYAYNIYDYSKEWIQEARLQGEDNYYGDYCWLDPIFKKNDGYSMPLAIFPDRRRGDISINRINTIAKQRLLSLFINSTDAPNSFRNITSNRAVAIRLTPFTYTKLQKWTLESYLMSSRLESSSLNWAIEKLSDLQKSGIDITEAELENWYNGEQYEVNVLLDDLLGITQDGKMAVGVPYAEYLQCVDAYVKKHVPNCFSNKRLKDTPNQPSDIVKYLYALRDYHRFLNRKGQTREFAAYLNFDEQRKKYKKYKAYNISQLARIYLIYQIAAYQKINPLIVCKPYDELTDVERGQHALIYEIISLFGSYSYDGKIEDKNKYPWDNCYEYDRWELGRAIELMEMDLRNDSYVTRELSQILSYIKECEREGDLYKRLAESKENKEFHDSSKSNEVLIGLDVIKKHYTPKGIQLSELPPSLYECDILFKRSDAYVEMGSLSSGERQLLNIIGVIMYHLYDLDRQKVYKAANLIFEEIELYFHPDYQRQLVYRLIKQIRGGDFTSLEAVNMLFVTHSPFILSDIPKENVLFLNNGIPDTQMQENTFGANIHSLLKNGFFLPNLTMGEFAYHKINRLFAKLNANDVKVTEIAELNKEITLVGEPYLREQLFKKFYSLPQVKQYFEALSKQ